MSDDGFSSSDEAVTIGVKPKAPLKGVTVRKAASFGTASIPVVTTPVATAAPKPPVSVAATPPVFMAKEMETTVAKKQEPVTATILKDGTYVTAGAHEKMIKEEATKAKSAKGQPTLPPQIKVKSLKPPIQPSAIPIDTFTMMSNADFTSPDMIETKRMTTKMDPIEVKPNDADTTATIIIPDPTDPSKTTPVTLPAYRPITAPSFDEFIIQTYMRYSPALLQLEEDLAKGIAEPTIKERELDPDACLKRDPNKVETFYYQKFVRDYLGRDTPYRGLLVYHGLGSGKTCTSIAAAEALHWGGLKKIYILTPATLSANYRRELGKCGYYPLRRHNHWSFLKSDESPAARTWLINSLGLPPEYIDKLGGGWVANPKKASNWDALTDAERASIRDQQEAHITHRFTFIHYNGISPATLADYAAKGVQLGKSIFDDGVVIIDEVHNLVRTINGSKIGLRTAAQYIEEVEPREFTWSVPKYREIHGFRYPRGYALYRLLQNAVGAKIIALSATPMINYAEEMAVLMNIIGGEQRIVEISLKHMRKGKDLTREIEQWAMRHPAIDFFKIEEGPDRGTVLTLTPVPHGFMKVVGADFATRGFVRPPVQQDARDSRERNMDKWAVSLVRELEDAGILDVGRGLSVEAAAAVEAARALGPGNMPATKAFRLLTLPLLPDRNTTFVEHFIDRARLTIKNRTILQARSLGLISYYRGGAEDLMPRSERVDIRVPMSDYVFKKYIGARAMELELEQSSKKAKREMEFVGAVVSAGVVRATDMEVDLYAQAMKKRSTGFQARTRAACNWVFPEDMTEKIDGLDERDRVKLLGITEDNIIAADAATDGPEPSMGGSGSSSNAAAAAAVATVDAAAEDEVGESGPLTAKLQSMLNTILRDLETKADDYLNKGLATYSPKYAVMVENIRTSPGPVLVYSQFKTLEGLGIFAAALRASDEHYLPLDIERSATGEWAIPDVLMDPALRDRPRYVLYTGDQELEKRRLLLQLYNADVAGLPPKLAAQCTELLAGAPDNRDGRVCRVFMITQSGAEGISLFNTRQVHIMEPYWNNVRIEQVIGRAIRLCSHMHLPWDDRLVTVFTYMSVFTEQQKLQAGEAKMVMMRDGGKTTDEVIQEIATIKQKLADGLSEVAQSAAVDCKLHYHEHGKVTKCFSFGEGRRPLFSHHPDWQKDIADAGLRSI